MAVRDVSIKSIARGIVEATWTGLLNGDTGVPLDAYQFADKTITVRGTFGAGGSITLKGSDLTDATATSSWDALNDSRGEGNALTFTARDTRVVAENPARMTPHVTAGDGTTSLTVVILARRLA